MIGSTRILTLLVMLLGLSAAAHAGLITSTLGNNAPGFNDNDTPFVFVVGGAQAGQPAPFDTSYGTDILGPNFMQSWTHNYAGIVDPILSASLTIGIFDHDSVAPGSQLALFDLDGTVLTATLDGLFEAVGEGNDGQYDVYTLMLPNSAFAVLTDGSALATLNLQGPGLVPTLFPVPGAPTQTGTNGANLIFSTLSITTQDPDPTVPEPGSLALFALGLGLLSRRKGYGHCGLGYARQRFRDRFARDAQH